MSELCDPTDAELHALCASATGPSHLESLIPLANYRDIVSLRRKLHGDRVTVAHHRPQERMA